MGGTKAAAEAGPWRERKECACGGAWLPCAGFPAERDARTSGFVIRGGRRRFGEMVLVVMDRTGGSLALLGRSPLPFDAAALAALL